MNLRQWLDKAEADLRSGPHPERARPDAETLLLHLVGKNRAWLITHLSEEFADSAAIGYAKQIERRLAGEPLQYITGETEFYGLPFRVTPDVLVPRPETEHLVDRVVHLIPDFDLRPNRSFEVRRAGPAFTHEKKERKRENLDNADWPPRILDIGTGSGAVAISIAHHWYEAEITATDISDEALDVARSNAHRLGVEECIRFLQGDLLAPVTQERFEIIVSNPPYVPATDRESLSVEVRDYEPARALFAGADGLDIYRHLIPQAFACLTSGGYIALEIGYGQSKPIQTLLIAAGFDRIEFTPDLQGIPRVATARRA
jgi:release factor glutamine methyltransferase